MPKKNEKQSKDKKKFMKDFKAELKKVIWPTPKQLLNNTIAVITIVLITAVIVFALDFVFKTMNTYGINKIKEVVESSDIVEDETNTDVNQTIEENSTTEENVVTDTNVINEDANNTTTNSANSETN